MPAVEFGKSAGKKPFAIVRHARQAHRRFELLNRSGSFRGSRLSCRVASGTVIVGCARRCHVLESMISWRRKSICGREEAYDGTVPWSRQHLTWLLQESAQSPHEPPRCRCGQTSKKSEADGHLRAIDGSADDLFFGAVAEQVRKDGPTKASVC